MFLTKFVCAVVVDSLVADAAVDMTRVFHGKISMYVLGIFHNSSSRFIISKKFYNIHTSKNARDPQHFFSDP